jgi:hypothetical protein
MAEQKLVSASTSASALGIHGYELVPSIMSESSHQPGQCLHHRDPSGLLVVWAKTQRLDSVWTTTRHIDLTPSVLASDVLPYSTYYLLISP